MKVLPQPGDFFVSTSNTGPWYKRSLPMLVRWVTDSDFNHAGICINERQVIEAQPGGVRYWTLTDYLDENTTWSQGQFIPNDPRLDGNVREKIVSAAEALLGRPYGLLDCVALGLAQTRLGSRADVKKALVDQPWWVRRLMSPDTVICSQLVDMAYQGAGIHLFQDGRLPDFVSPGDLGRLLQA